MIVIVGHGPSPVGKGWGKEIDRHPVARMKDLSWQNWKDYGARLDFWCCSTEIMGWFQFGAREYWAQPKRGFWDAKHESAVRAKGIHPQIDLDLFQRWNQVYTSLTDKHRNYCLGIHCILKVCEKGEQPCLVGFDNLLSPGLPYRKADKGKWPSDHDWAAENAMLPLIEKNYGVQILAMTSKGVLPWRTA